MKTNYHTHSLYCDGKASVSDMAQAAVEHGFSVLGMSSHAPLPFPTTWTMRAEDIGSYFDEIEKAQEKIGASLSLMAGLEIDYIEAVTGPAHVQYPELSYSIGSVHYINPGHTKAGDTLFTVDEGQEKFDRHVAEHCNGDYERAVGLYYRTVCDMIKAGGFTILGHLDLIRKNNPDESRFSERTSFYRDAVMEVVDTLRGSGIVAEINTGGIARGKTKAPYPSDWILRELYARSIPICLNADAHAPEHLYGYYDRGLQAALDAGYRTQTVPVLGDFAREHGLAVSESASGSALLTVISL